MPYIKLRERNRIDADLTKVLMASQGELTYPITKLMMNYVEQRGMLDYSMSSLVMASCQDAANEWARQVHEKYEDHKKRENGDCFQEFVRKQNI